MATRTHHTGWASVTAHSWRLWAQRFSFVVFMALALGLLALGRARPPVTENIRANIVDTLAPVLDAAERPMAFIDTMTQTVGSYIRLRSENARLRSENAQLAQWQNAVFSLQNENKALRSLLHYKPEPKLAYISARVIADTGGPFVRTLIVTAGKVDGVREGMAAMTGEGLIGRVVEAGNWSSRILLITDLNSRIPVTVSGSGDHAILAGDNAAQPKLLYLPQDTAVKQGDRLITSGHGGIFPPDLPVGVVASVAHGAYAVEPLASLGHINQVQLVDFNLAGGAFNPIAAKVEADTPEH